MKKFSSIMATTLLSLACFASCNAGEGSVSAGTEPVWGDYTESTESIVYEVFNYDIPIVKTPDEKNELPVTVSVKDSAGNVIDSAGGFFCVRGLDDYTVTYTVEYNGKVYTKTATVTGIPKVEYTLNHTTDYQLFIYDKGEEVDINEILTSSLDNEIRYTVNNNGRSVPVSEGKFIADAVGSYDIIVSMKSQADYEFRVYAVDAGSLDTVVYAPNVEDEIIVYNPDYISGWGNAIFDAEKTHESSESSIKIEMNSHNHPIGVNFAPSSDIANYAGLAKEGYNYVSYYFQYSDYSSDGAGALRVYVDGINDATVLVDKIAYDDVEGVVERLDSKSSGAVLWGWNGEHNSTGWCEIRIPIGIWLENFDGTTQITLKAEYNDPSGFTFWFGGCKVIKVAK